MGKKMNVDLSGKTLRVLTLDDVIEKGDYCRPLHESASRDGGFDTTYRNPKWQGTMWQSVKNDFSGWIGRTQRDYLHFDEDEKTKKQIDESGYMELEIVRVLG